MKPSLRCAIHPMSLDDFAQVLELWGNTEGVGLSDSDSPANLAAYLERNPGLSFVARDSHGIIGAVLCGHDGRRGYLHHLAVAKPHRRRGVGKELVRTCLERLAAVGIPKCNIFLFSDNAEGQLFWEADGWVLRNDLCVMQRSLS
jgi:N-acetylglutamate synthase